MRRSDDWMRQANADLKHAKASLELEHFEWSCLAAQQAAEKAVKAVFQELHADAWGHSIGKLLERLPKRIDVPKKLINRVKTLDRHYIPSRYPNGLIDGAPVDAFSDYDAKEAIKIAKETIEFCQDTLSTIKRESDESMSEAD